MYTRALHRVVRGSQKEHHKVGMPSYNKLPRSIGPVIHVPPSFLGMLPTLDKNLWKLTVVLLALFENDVQGSFGPLLGGQIGHVTATQISFQPLNTYVASVSIESCKGGKVEGQWTYAGAEGDEGKSFLLVLESVLDGKRIHSCLRDFVGGRREGSTCAG